MTRKVVERQTLYEEVWARPMRQLACDYGISDVALGKICARLGVPRPGVGHWAKVRAGKKVSRKTLPKLKPGEPETYTITAVERFSCSPGQSSNLPRIPVAAELTEPHSLVARARKSLRNAPKDDLKRLAPRTNRCLDIRVSRSSLDRALRIMDALIRACEEQGWHVDIEPRVINHPGWRRREEQQEEVRQTSVVIDEQRIEVTLEEVMKGIEVLPDQSEAYPWRRTTYRYEPTGRLRLEIGSAPGSWGQQHRWNDGKKRRLEDVLHRVVAGLARTAEARVEHKKRMEEAEAARQEQARRAEEERRRKQVLEGLEEDVTKRLELVARGDQFKQLAAFVETSLTGESLEAAASWIDWLRQRSSDYQQAALQGVPPLAWTAPDEFLAQVPWSRRGY